MWYPPGWELVSSTTASPQQRTMSARVEEKDEEREQEKEEGEKKKEEEREKREVEASMKPIELHAAADLRDDDHIPYIV